jgi:serine/threonine-protein kinase RsbW
MPLHVTAESWTLQAAPEAPRHARRLTGAYAAAHGADAETLTAIALCVTEAVTNVVVHAYRDADEPGVVMVEMQKPDGYLCLYVRDHGTGIVPKLGSPGLGLGLSLISGIAASCELRTSDGEGTEVIMRFDLPAAAVLDA